MPMTMRQLARLCQALAILVCLIGVGHAQTTALSPVAKQIFFGSTGSYVDQPLAGGKIYTYAAGTTTPATTYSDSTGMTANPNPIILDSAGFASIWLTPGAFYKFVAQDANGVQQWSVDEISTSVTGRFGLLIDRRDGASSL